MVDLSKTNIISQAQKLRNYGEALRNATIKKNGIIRPPAQAETIYSYSGYDTEGNEVNLTEDQYNQLIKASEGNTSKYYSYNVIPSEVANSGANWYINQDGLYEWVPVTASDKAHLDKINSQRTSSGLSPRNTLITGAAWSEEFTNEWYTKTGNNRGKGESNVRIVSKSSDHTGQIQLKDGTWINQYEQLGNSKKDNVIIYSSKEARQAAIEVKNKANEEALEKAKSYSPILSAQGEEINPIQVTGISKESTSGAKGIFSGNGYYSRSQAVADYGMKKIAAKEAAKASVMDIVSSSSPEVSVLNSNGLLGSLGLDYSKEQTAIKTAKESGVTTTGLSTLDKANTAIASKLTFLPSSEAVRSSWDSMIESKHGEYGSYGYGDLLEAIGQKNAAESYRNIDTAITEGVQDFVIEEYEGLKTTPASKAIEYGAYYAGGAVFGAATKGLKVGSAAAGKALIKPISGLAAKTESKLIEKSGSVLISSLKSGKIVDIGLGAGLVYGSGKEIASSYSESGLQGATKTSLNIGLSLGIGAQGFKKGYDTTERVIEGDYIAAMPVVKAAKISELKGGGSSIEPVDLKYGYTIAPFDKPIISGFVEIP